MIAYDGLSLEEVELRRQEAGLNPVPPSPRVPVWKRYRSISSPQKSASFKTSVMCAG